MRGPILGSRVLASLCLLIVSGCASIPQPAAPAAAPLPPSPVALPASPTPAATPDPRMQLAQAFQDGLNRGDGAAVAALFVDKGMGYMDSGTLIADKAGVADYIDEGELRHWNLQLSQCAAQGDLWHCKSVEREDCLKVVTGMDELRTDMTLTEKDGKIQYIEFKPSAEDRAAIKQGTDKFWTWVRVERAAEWKALATPAARERGELISKLCKEYVATDK